ncbi:MAG: OmpH family outer membrane protein [Candidatus Gygaella obscura]|nr:OmpH family outer membrane protein [Candidatus Gygaella obscura]
MQRIRPIAILFILTFLVSNVLYAAEGLVYMDLKKVLASYAKTKKYDSALEKEQKEYKSSMEKKVAELKKMQSALSVLNENEKAKKQEVIEQKLRDLRNFEEIKQSEISKEYNLKMKDIFDDIDVVIKLVAEKKGYSLVLDERFLLYADDNHEITDEIIKELNK